MVEPANSSRENPLLKQRIATALILLPLVLAAIFVLPVRWFIVALFLVALMAIGEYRRLAGLGRKTSGNILVILQAVILLTLALSQIYWNIHIVFSMIPHGFKWQNKVRRFLWK